MDCILCKKSKKAKAALIARGKLVKAAMKRKSRIRAQEQ